MRGDQGFPVRIRFSKRARSASSRTATSLRAFERAFRIEVLPLAFTEGFSPRPKVSFGLALSVGHRRATPSTSTSSSPKAVDTDTLSESLTPALPEGMPATGAVRLVERAPALQESITEVQYRVEPVDGLGRPVAEAVLASAASRALACDELSVTRTRQGKESVDDLRPALGNIEVGRDGDTPVLELTLLTQSVVPDLVRSSTPSTRSSASASHRAPRPENIPMDRTRRARGWNRWPPTRSRSPSR